MASETVNSCGRYPNEVFVASSDWGMLMRDLCPNGQLTINSGAITFHAGEGAIWQASAPAGLVINGATIPDGGINAYGVNAGSHGQYGGDFYWQGGSSQITPTETGATLGPFSSHDFGILMVCGKASCTAADGVGNMFIGPVELSVGETSGPWLSSPAGLWQSKGWVRGTWNLGFWGNSPSGLCGLVANFGDLPLPGSNSVRDPAAWRQCTAGPVNDSVVTEGYAQGPNTAVDARPIDRVVLGQTPHLMLADPGYGHSVGSAPVPAPRAAVD
jgi:hypothetical protein